MSYTPVDVYGVIGRSLGDCLVVRAGASIGFTWRLDYLSNLKPTGLSPVYGVIDGRGTAIKALWTGADVTLSVAAPPWGVVPVVAEIDGPGTGVLISYIDDQFVESIIGVDLVPTFSEFSLQFDAGTASGSVGFASLAVTRATATLAPDAAGVWSSFAINTLAYTNAGLVVYPAYTQTIRNSSGVGAVAGTPGTIPTSWTTVLTNANGLTRQMIASGTENGLPFVKVHWFGSPTVSFASNILPELSTGTLAAQDETWSSGIVLSLEAGSTMAGITWSSGIQELTAAGALIGAGYTQTFVPTVGAPYGSEVWWQQHINVDPTCARTRDYLQSFVSSGVAFDLTMKVTLVHAKTPMPPLPVISTTVAVLRAADVITLPYAASVALGGLKIRAVAPNGLMAKTVLWTWDKGAATDQLCVYRDEGGYMHVQSVVAGVTYDLTLTEAAAGATFQVEFAWGGGRIQGRLDALPVRSMAASIPSGLTVMRPGQDSAGNQWSGRILGVEKFGGAYTPSGTAAVLSDWQQGGFRSQPPDEVLTATAGWECVETRDPLLFGAIAGTQLRLGFSGYWADIDGNEVNIGNAQQIQAAIEVVGGSVTQLRWGGSLIGSIPDGEAEYYHDTVTAAQVGLAAFHESVNGTVFLRQRRFVATGQKHSINDPYNVGTGASAINHNGTVPSQLLNTGIYSIAGGGANYVGGHFFPTTMLLPRAEIGAGRAAVCIGDSLSEGYGDAATGAQLTAQGGYWQRAFGNVNGHLMPFIKLARGGTDSDHFTAAKMAKRKALLAYCNTATVCLGTNGRQPAPLATQDILNLCSMLSSYGIGTIIVGTMYPRILTPPGTPGAVTWPISDQTTATNWNSGGLFAFPFKDKWVPFMLGKCGVTHTVNLHTAVADATFPDHWGSSDGTQANLYTGDGTHATVTGNVALLVPAKAVLESLP